MAKERMGLSIEQLSPIANSGPAADAAAVDGEDKDGESNRRTLIEPLLKAAGRQVHGYICVDDFRIGMLNAKY